MATCGGVERPGHRHEPIAPTTPLKRKVRPMSIHHQCSASPYRLIPHHSQCLLLLHTYYSMRCLFPVPLPGVIYRGNRACRIKTPVAIIRYRLHCQGERRRAPRSACYRLFVWGKNKVISKQTCGEKMPLADAEAGPDFSYGRSCVPSAGTGEA